jgi:hypothetical protein
MNALMALQLRILWRGIPAFLRVAWGFLIFFGIAVVSKGRITGDSMSGLLGGSMVVAFIGVVAAIGTGESMSWFAPLRPSERTWARFAFLGVTGVAASAIILAVFPATSSRLPSPWPVVAANLWACWVGGGLLVLFLGDLVHSQHPLIQTICVIAVLAPAFGLSVYHLGHECPWQFVLAEAGVVALLVGITRMVNVDEEMRENEFITKALRQPGAKSEEAVAVPAESSCRNLDRIPALAPVFLRSMTAFRPTWALTTVWMVCAAVPLLVVHALFGLVCLPVALQSMLNYWRPFQTVPLSRPKVFVLLTAPVLALWVTVVAVQSVSCWAFADASLLKTGHDGLEWRLPAAKRSRDSDLSSEFRRGPLPRDPARLAALMSEAYRAAYGLDISAMEILALPVPADADIPAWLRLVERHWSPAVSRRMLEWRLLLGTALLAIGMLSMISLLPGRCPAWLRYFFLTGGVLLPMMALVFLSLETNPISNYSPYPFRSLYLAIYDRPGMLTAALAVASVALYFRHLRVFGTSEIAEQRVRI